MTHPNDPNAKENTSHDIARINELALEKAAQKCADDKNFVSDMLQHGPIQEELVSIGSALAESNDDKVSLKILKRLIDDFNKEFFFDGAESDYNLYERNDGATNHGI